MIAPHKSVGKPRILFALVDSGMGHKSPALAVKEHLERVTPGRYEVITVDLLSELGLKELDRFVKRGWSGVLLRYPWLIGVIHGIGHAFSGLLAWSLAWIAAPLLTLADSYCKSLQPALVVATHFVTVNFLAILRQQHRIGVPVVGMVVDPFETYRIASHPGLDALVTFSHRSHTVYHRRLPTVEVTRFDFPLSARYAGRPESRATARRRLGIPPERFVLLMTAGGEGVGNLRGFLGKIVEARFDMHVIVVCGRNVGLRRELQDWTDQAASAGGTATELTILGFVDTMHRLITASDVFLGAGGANLTFEALSLGRPAILTLYTPNIRGTVDYVVRNGFGWRCTRVKEFVHLVRRLLGEPGLVADAQRRIAAAGIHSGTPELAAYLLGFIGEGPPSGGRRSSRTAGARLFPRRPVF